MQARLPGPERRRLDVDPEQRTRAVIPDRPFAEHTAARHGHMRPLAKYLWTAHRSPPLAAPTANGRIGSGVVSDALKVRASRPESLSCYGSGNLPRAPTRRPGPLEVVAAQPTCHVDHLAYEIQPGNRSRFHGSGIQIACI